MSRLSSLAVSQRSVTLLLAFALFVGGISAWGSLKQELLPDIDFPVITVIAPYPGAGATDVAAQVAEPIEQAIKGVPNLSQLQSTSANSIALAVAQFEFGTDVKERPGDDRGEHPPGRAARTQSSRLSRRSTSTRRRSSSPRSRPPARTGSMRPPRSPRTRSCPPSAASMASPAPTSRAASSRRSSSRSIRPRWPRPA